MPQTVAVNQGVEPGLLIKASGGAGALAEYFEGRKEKPSARIFANLASDPIVDELLRRKQPTYRELTFVVSTVVSALDNRIEELEASARPWERLTNTLNAPLFDVEPKRPNKIDPPGGETKVADEADVSEAKWILKYLTLRNLGGVLVTALTLSTGFFAFINKDHKTVMDMQEVQIGKLREELNTKKTEAEKAVAKLQEKEFQFKELERRLAAADQANAASQNRIIELEKKRDQAIVEGAAGQVELAKELADARLRTGDLEKSLQATRGDLSKARTNWQAEAASAATRATTLSSLETKLETAESKLNSLIDAWNTLLDFLGSRREGSQIQVSTQELRSYLKELRRYTDRVGGAMKSFR